MRVEDSGRWREPRDWTPHRRDSDAATSTGEEPSHLFEWQSSEHCYYTPDVQNALCIVHFSFVTIQDCELSVCQVLKWEISIVTPHDFLEQILFRLSGLADETVGKLRRKSRMLIAICSTGRHFSVNKLLTVELRCCL